MSRLENTPCVFILDAPFCTSCMPKTFPSKVNARGFPRASTLREDLDQNPDLISSNSSIILSRSSVVGGDCTKSGVVTGST